MAVVSQEIYFCRGGDLYDKEFNGPDVEVYDTVYVNEGHERYGNWNYILYFLEAETGGSGSGELLKILRSKCLLKLLVLALLVMIWKLR